MKNIFIGFFTAYLCASIALGADGCPQQVQSYQDILHCAEQVSPDVKQSLLDSQKAKAQMDLSRQWRNPEFSAESWQNTSHPGEKQETDLSLSFAVDLSGQRAVKAAESQSGAHWAEVHSLQTRIQLRHQILLKLHRLRQTLHEKEIVDEAVETFSKLVKQYSQRPHLSPEQQISVSVFQLSRSDYELKRRSIQDEIATLTTYFKSQTGLTLEQIKGHLPASFAKWPAAPIFKDSRVSLQEMKAMAELEKFQAEAQLARSEAWSDITVGPSLKLSKEAGQSEQMLGINLSFPFPIFNVNGSGRALAKAAELSSENKKRQIVQEQELKREELRQIYEGSVQALVGILSHEEIEKKHESAEKLFMRGVVPSSLVIEAHRTSYDLEKSRHEREMIALQAWLELKELVGQHEEIAE